MECPYCREYDPDKLKATYTGIAEKFMHCLTCDMWWGKKREPFRLEEEPKLKEIIEQALKDQP